MANVSQFVPQQFVDAGSLTSLATNVSSAITSLTSGIYQGGLVSPTSIGFSSSGLIATITLPPPFQIIFGNGVSSFAHGTINGQDTQSYSINFTSFVPASGTITAYVLASYIQILQNQSAIVGPPPGHPDFNPNFQAYLAYSAGVDSISLAASSGVADNLTTFEIARISLTSTSTGIAQFITAYQERAAEKYHLPNIPLVGFNITNAAAGKLLTLPTSGLYTLPTLSSASTQTYFFTTQATSGLTLIQANVSDPFGANLIYGTTQNPIFPAPVIELIPGGAVWLAAADGFWQVLNGVPYARGTMFRAMLVGDTNYYINASTGSNTNNGLSPSSAWQTLQYGHDFLHNNFDLAGFQATFNCVGNFTAGLVSSGPWVGQDAAGSVLFQFTSGSSIIVSGADCFHILGGSNLTIAGPVTLSSPVTGVPEGGYGISCQSSSQCFLGQGLIYSTCAIAHIRSGAGGLINIQNTYTITGGASSHLFAQGSSLILSATIGLPSPPTLPFTVTLTGTPTFSSAFALATDLGQITFGANQITYSGSASGSRYTANLNAVIDTDVSGSNYFPGSASGTTAVGGVYF